MYTLQIKFMVGDTAYDVISKKRVTILGVAYTNGQLTKNSLRYFHEMGYFIDSEEENGLRLEDELLSENDINNSVDLYTCKED